jgi:predicted nucleotidyltransferase
MDAQRLTMSPADLDGFCRRHHIQRLSLFGSILTSRFRGESDIDILVEFEPGNAPTLFDIAGMELELSEKLGRQVDLRTLGDLSRYFRHQVAAAAVVQYERA